MGHVAFCFAFLFLSGNRVISHCKRWGSRPSPALTAPGDAPVCVPPAASGWAVTWLMFLPRSDQELVVQRGKARGVSVLAEESLAESGIQYRGAGYTAHCPAGWQHRPSKPALRPRFSWFQLPGSPACPATFTNPPSLAFPVTLRALNSLSLNSFSVSVGQSGFLWFVNKEPDRSGKKTKALRAANSE